MIQIRIQLITQKNRNLKRNIFVINLILLVDNDFQLDKSLNCIHIKVISYVN